MNRKEFLWRCVAAPVAAAAGVKLAGREVADENGYYQRYAYRNRKYANGFVLTREEYEQYWRERTREGLEVNIFKG